MQFRIQIRIPGKNQLQSFCQVSFKKNLSQNNPVSINFNELQSQKKFFNHQKTFGKTHLENLSVKRCQRSRKKNKQIYTCFNQQRKRKNKKSKVTKAKKSINSREIRLSITNQHTHIPHIRCFYAEYLTNTLCADFSRLKKTTTLFVHVLIDFRMKKSRSSYYAPMIILHSIHSRISIKIYK